MLEKHVNEVQKRLFEGLIVKYIRKLPFKWSGKIPRTTTRQTYTKSQAKDLIIVFCCTKSDFRKLGNAFLSVKTHFRNLENTILTPEFHFQEVGYENLDTKREFWRFGSIISSSFCSCDCTLYHQPCNDSSSKSGPHLPWCHECGQKP